MEKLLSILNSIPEYTLLRAAAEQGRSAAVTGIGQINRSHLIAALRQDIRQIQLCNEPRTFRKRTQR